MATVSIANTTANVQGKTVVLAERDHTITGSWTFNRSPSAPFVVQSGSGNVANLDADKLDGFHGPASAIVGINDTQTLLNKTLTSPAIVTPTISTPAVTLGSFNGPSIVNGTFSGATFIDQPTIPFTVTTFTPVWGNTGSSNTLGNGTSYGQYTQIGKLIYFDINLTWGSTTASGDGAWLFTVPVVATGLGPATGGVGCVFFHVGGGYMLGTAAGNSSSVLGPLANAGSGYSTGVTATTPFTWAVGDSINISGSYLAA